MKKYKITSRWYYGSYLPIMILLWLLGLMLINTGCTKDAWKLPLHNIDSSYYLTLNINSKKYTSYAWDGGRAPMFVYSPSIYGIFEDKSDSTGAPINWNLLITAFAESDLSYVQTPSTFSASILLNNKGDLFGQYNASGSFSDVDGKSYRIDTNSSHFTIMSMSPPTAVIPYVDGNFECIVYEENGIDGIPIHASGTFRLKAF